jgi:uncharacterized protein (TIGR02246 family)
MNSRTTQTAMNIADDAALSNLYQQVIEGWNRGSGEVFAAPFTDDADFVAFDGTYLKGRQEIASAHQQLFDTFLKGTRLVGKVRNLRYLTPEVAVMIAVGGTVMPGQPDLEVERNSIHTFVAVKHDDTWRFAAFQNSRVQYMGRPEATQELTAELRQLL